MAEVQLNFENSSYNVSSIEFMYLLYMLSFGHILIPYGGKFLRTINFAVFMDFTSTMKIIFSKFLPEQVACLCDQINCFTCVVT